eukprot:Gb_24009 [translate_table: standard]
MLQQVCGGKEDAEDALLIVVVNSCQSPQGREGKSPADECHEGSREHIRSGGNLRVLKDLQNKREENYKKASIICPEEELEALGACHGSTPEQLNALLSRLIAIDDLRMKFAKCDHNISKKRCTYVGFCEKLDDNM